MNDSLEEGVLNLLPDRYRNRDFFVADFCLLSFKDDTASMEHPFFSLSMQRDLRERRYAHNGNSIVITPSTFGMPTMWDKDVLIYLTSQYVQAINLNREDVEKRRVRFTAYDYLVNTNRKDSGEQYERLQLSLRRLRGMTIVTTVQTGKQRIDEGFGLIDRWRSVKGPNGRMVACEVTLSEWLHRAIVSLEVLTINKDYFRLAGGLERRLYEIARKHCGEQAQFKIGLELLWRKTGSTATLKEFRRQVRAVAGSDVLPDYRVAYLAEPDQVQFYTRDIKRLARSLAQKGSSSCE